MGFVPQTQLDCPCSLITPVDCDVDVRFLRAAVDFLQLISPEQRNVSKRHFRFLLIADETD